MAVDDAPADLENVPRNGASGGSSSSARPEVVVPPPPPFSARPPRILIIGAGSRGRTYARCTKLSTNGIVVAVAEPDDYKRRSFVRTFIRPSTTGKAEEDDDDDGGDVDMAGTAAGPEQAAARAGGTTRVVKQRSRKASTLEVAIRLKT